MQRCSSPAAAAKLHALHINLPRAQRPRPPFQARHPPRKGAALSPPAPRPLLPFKAAAAAVQGAIESGGEEQEVAQVAASLSLRDLWALLRPDWFLVAGCFAATFVSVASFVCVAPCLGKVIDVISAPGSTVQQLVVATATLGGVYICSNLALALQVALAMDVGESLGARLRRRLFRALLGHSAEFYDTARTGAMTSWLGQDVEVLQATVTKLLGARGMRAVLETVGIISVLFYLSPPLAAALLLAAPLVGPVVAAATRNIRGASQGAEETASAAAAAADEVVENIRIVRAFSAEQRQIRRYQGLVDAAHAAAIKVVKLQTLLDVSGRARNTLCVMLTLSMGAHLALAGRVTIGVCYSFFVYSFSFAFALSNVTNTMGDLSRAAGTVARTLWVLRRCEAEDARSSERSGRRRIDAAAFRGEIEFRNVCFSHPGGWSMRNVSFLAPAGSTLALVGPSGGGKSTIAALLLGLYTPESGEILIDGVPLRELDLNWWRRQVGVVEQAPGLLTGALEGVVRYGKPEATPAEISSALADAQATGFVAGLPAGAETTLGPGGVELSGGQRQRLALARALLPRPGVLVLDEATSALDVGTESAVADALQRRGGARSDNSGAATMVVIAHRLSTVRRADRIVVVAGGGVVEAGPPRELEAMEGGVYARMLRRAEEERGGDSVSGEWGEVLNVEEGREEEGEGARRAAAAATAATA